MRKKREYKGEEVEKGKKKGKRGGEGGNFHCNLDKEYNFGQRGRSKNIILILIYIIKNLYLNLNAYILFTYTYLN